jgi:hypothetical protein
MNIANSNCIAAIIGEYGRFLESYARHMHGVRFDTNQYNGVKKRKSDCILDRHQGICGTTLAMAGANDTTSAGKMHAHLLRCSCPQPHVVTRIGKGSKRLCKELVQVLSTQYHTEFDRSIHIFQLLHLFLQSLDQEHQEYRYPYLRSSNFILPYLMDVPPSAVNEQHEFHAFEQIHSSRTQWHLHSFQCHQKHHGKDGCCSDYPRPLKASGDPIMLEPVFDTNNELESYFIKDYDADTERVTTTKPVTSLPKDDLLEGMNAKEANEGMLLSLFERTVNHNVEVRVINWDTQRRLLEGLPPTESENKMMNNIIQAMNDTQHLQSVVKGVLAQLQANNHLRSAYQYINSRLKAANGSVVAYNKTFTACFGSNCAMYHLGTLNDSINAVHYMITYPMEDSISLKKSLTILVHANSVWINKEKHKRDTPDRTQPEQHVKFLLQHVLNKLSSHLEFSDMLAAHIVLGGTQLLSTEHYVSCNVNDLLLFIDRGKDFDLSLSGQDRLLLRDSIETHEESLRQRLKRLKYCQGPCHKGLYHVKDAKGNVVHAPVAYATHYKFRGYLLQNINRKEYTELIVVRPITQADTAVTTHQAGRPKNAVYLFDKGHPLWQTHCQAIRSKHGCLRLSYGIGKNSTIGLHKKLIHMLPSC